MVKIRGFSRAVCSVPEELENKGKVGAEVRENGIVQSSILVCTSLGGHSVGMGDDSVFGNKAQKERILGTGIH